jgi:hypothetical protein
MKQINRTVAGTAHDSNVIPYYSFGTRNAPLNPKTETKVSGKFGTNFVETEYFVSLIWD